MDLGSSGDGDSSVNQLSPRQRELVTSLTQRLGAIHGVRAVVLGGSHVRGRAHPTSDIDLGLLYSEAAPFAIESVRGLAESVNDTAGPVVAGFYEWGPWVNGGAWLTIGEQRVDLIYRSIERLGRAITDAEAGRYEVHYAQQPQRRPSSISLRERSRRGYGKRSRTPVDRQRNSQLRSSASPLWSAKR